MDTNVKYKVKDFIPSETVLAEIASFFNVFGYNKN